MRRETPSPCSSPVLSAFRMSRSSVPCRRLVWLELMRGFLSTFCRNVAPTSYRMSIGEQAFWQENSGVHKCLPGGLLCDGIFSEEKTRYGNHSTVAPGDAGNTSATTHSRAFLQCHECIPAD